MKADVLLFVEVGKIRSYKIPGFKLLSGSIDSKSMKTYRGYLCYIKESLFEFASFMLDNSESYNFSQVEIFILRIKNIGICGIYKSPKTNQMLLRKEFEKINLKSIIECYDDFFVVGDFNLNLNNNEGEDLINSLNLIDVMNKESVTTDHNTRIDWILSKKKEGFMCGVYESYFSYHKPLWITVNEFENDVQNTFIKTDFILKKSDTQMSIHYTDYKMNDSDSSSNYSNDSEKNLYVLTICLLMLILLLQTI
jgi:hypothetical protein